MEHGGAREKVGNELCPNEMAYFVDRWRRGLMHVDPDRKGFWVFVPDKESKETELCRPKQTERLAAKPDSKKDAVSIVSPMSQADWNEL